MNGCSVSMESYLPRVSRPGDEFRDETASFQGTKEKDKRQTYPKRIPQLLLFLILIGGGGFIRTYVAHDFHELFEADISISWKNKKKKETYHARQPTSLLFCFWVNFRFLFFFFPPTLFNKMAAIYLNAIHPESLPFSRFLFLLFFSFFFNKQRSLYILYVHFFINTSTLFLLPR